MYVAMNGFSVAIDTEKNIIRRWSYILNTLRHVFFSYFNIYLNFHSLEIKYYIYLTLLKQVSFAIINEGSRLKKGRKILHNIIFPWAHIFYPRYKWTIERIHYKKKIIYVRIYAAVSS